MGLFAGHRRPARSYGVSIDHRPPQSDLFGTFRENEGVLIRFLARRVRCRTTAQDLAQELVIRIQRAPWQAVYNPRAFLFRMAANLASTHRSQARRRAEVADELKELLSSDVDEVTPERQLLAADELQRVAAVLESLPERTRQILVWHRYDGVQQVEIARQLGISTTAVEKHLRKALTLLTQAARAEQEKY